MGWYLREGSGEPQGPFPESEIVTALSEGESTAGVTVRAEGDLRWIAVTEHPPFARAVERARGAGGPQRESELGLYLGIMFVPLLFVWKAFAPGRSVGVRLFAVLYLAGIAAFIGLLVTGNLKF